MSFIIGTAFTMEAVGVLLSLIFVLKRVVFNGASPVLILLVALFSTVFFLLGQLCFYFTRKRNGYYTIFEHPYVRYFVEKKEEEVPVRESIIEGRDIAQIENGEIVFATGPEEETEDLEELNGEF